MTGPKAGKILLIAVVLILTLANAYAYPPDNAAVLYYKAAALYGVDEDMQSMLDDLQKGIIEINDQIRDYINANRMVIHAVLDAAEVKNCDWGLDFSQGYAIEMPHLQSCRRLARLIAADVKIQAAGGNYETAISRCMSLHRMSRHVNDRIYIQYLVAIAIDALANDCLTQIISEMPQDTQSMTRLKDQLIEIDSIPLSIMPSILGERDIMLSAMALDKLPEIAKLCETCDPTETENALSLDEAAIERNREYYMQQTADIIDAVDLPYIEGHAALMELNKKLEEDVNSDPDLILVKIVEPASAQILTLKTKFETHNNAIRTAIELYLIKAKIGRLPGTLPEGLPKDLFSGQDFDYEKNSAGFILRCKAMNLDKNETYQYEFKIKK